MTTERHPSARVRDARGRFKAHARRGVAALERRTGHHFGISRTGAKGAIQKYVPLTSSESRHDLRSHKGSALLGAGGGLIIVGPMTAAGGTIAGALTTLGGAVALKALSMGGRGSAVAAGFAITGGLVVLANAIAGRSLIGTARLGSTLRNLKSIASRVQMGDVGVLGRASIAAVGLDPLHLKKLGIAGLGQTVSVPPILKKLAAELGLAPPTATQGQGLRGPRFGSPYSPVNLVGGRSGTGLGSGSPFSSEGFQPQYGTGREWHGPDSEFGGPYGTPNVGLGVEQPVDGLRGSRALGALGNGEQERALAVQDIPTARQFGPTANTHVKTSQGWIVPIGN